MSAPIPMKIIATMRSAFPTKFGIPRQSGLVDSLRSTIVFEPPYRNPDALRGMEGFSHLWLIWSFSKAVREDWSPTVRPPRLGGNTRMGVFATRSPFRPNGLGLSSVELVAIEKLPNLGKTLLVAGADLMDGTPIYDVKPYLPFTDSHPKAKGGFTEWTLDYHIEVYCPEALLQKLPESKREPLLRSLALDPRPAYLNDSDAPYGFAYAGFDVRFYVKDGLLTVFDIVEV